MKSLKPQKRTKKERRKNRRKNIIIIVLLCIIFSSFIYIMNHRKFRLSSFEVYGVKTLLDSDINTIVEKYLDGKILGLIPHDNIVFINTRQIEKDIQNSFPKIYNVKTLIKENSYLVITVEEREPHSLWCKNENYESYFDEECFFADQRGYIYSEAPYFSGGVFEKIYTTDTLLKIGEQVMDKKDFDIFFKFTQSLTSNYGITVDRIFVNENNETRIYIKSLLKKNFTEKPYIIYHSDEAYDVIGRNIGLMIDHEFFKKEWKNNPQGLEYIDVRIPDQIRYKFSSEEEYKERQNKEQKDKEENENNTETTE